MISGRNLSKVYAKSGGEVRSLDDLSLEIQRGEFLVVRGPSGSGKTTLLLTLGGMLRPTAGQVIFEGQNLYDLNPKARARFRAQQIGFVFQMFHLVPYLTVIENVELAAGNGRDVVRPAAALLEQLGLQQRLRHTPAELSAGERQRVAVARALVNQPALILADEPTGNLDPDNAGEIFRRLRDFHRGGGTVVVVTHGHQADEGADRVIELRQGKI